MNSATKRISGMQSRSLHIHLSLFRKAFVALGAFREIIGFEFRVGLFDSRFLVMSPVALVYREIVGSGPRMAPGAAYIVYLVKRPFGMGIIFCHPRGHDVALLAFIAEILMKLVRWDIVFMTDITCNAIGKIGMSIILYRRNGAGASSPRFSAAGGASQHNKNTYYAHNYTYLLIHESTPSERLFFK